VAEYRLNENPAYYSVFRKQPSWMHEYDRCRGQKCVFHNPSPHSMWTWPYIVRETALIERLCTHGVGHPDPDSVAWFDGMGLRGYGVHGCDGCCV
jgi:hypothetical protein